MNRITELNKEIERLESINCETCEMGEHIQEKIYWLEEEIENLI